MNIVFKTISLTNFRSFRGNHTFKVQDTGLYLVHGSNCVDERLDSNGVGKSSLFEALSYVLEGRTSKGLKRTDVTTWGEKECSVSAWLVIDTISYTITRATDTGTLLQVVKAGEKEKIPQEQIYQYLGVPPQFMYAVIFSQFQQGFFELKPMQRLDYFCDLFNFNIWDDYREKAKQRTKRVGQLLFEQEKLLTDGLAWLASVREQCSDILVQQNTWKKAQQEKQRITAKESHSLQAKRNACKQESLPVEQEIETLRIEIKLLDEQERKDEYIMEKAKQDILQGGIMKDLALEKLQEDRLFVKQINSRKAEEVCSQCGAPISDSVLAQQTSDRKENTSALEQDFVYKKSVWLEFKGIEAQAQRTYEVSQKKYDVATSRLQSLFKKQTSISNELNWLCKQLEEQNKIQTETSPYDSLLQKIYGTLKVLPRYIEALQQAVHVIDEEKKIAEYWYTTGFTAIKLLLVRSVSESYETLVNNYLDKLGLLDWHITIVMEKELKSGGFKAQFEVLVSCKTDGNKNIPLSAWSGGELQRLKLAGNLALADLISFWNNIKCNLFVMDECSSYLSGAGISDILSILKEKAAYQTVYVIEQKDFESRGDFQGLIHVVKETGGSKIEDLS